MFVFVSFCNAEQHHVQLFACNLMLMSCICHLKAVVLLLLKVFVSLKQLLSQPEKLTSGVVELLLGMNTGVNNSFGHDFSEQVVL